MRHTKQPQTKSSSPKAPNTSHVHVGNGPAVSPAYAYNKAIENRAIQKALSVRARAR